jgi:hypothetical protein
MGQADIVQGRNCDSCALCCKLLSVAELDKEPLDWCPHCTSRTNCSIYAARPTECRQFFCQYLLDERLGPHWKPTRSKMVVSWEEYANTLVIHTDPARPDAWRREPYLSDIRRWAHAAAMRGQQMVVWVGDSKIVLVPDAANANDAARIGL